MPRRKFFGRAIKSDEKIRLRYSVVEKLQVCCTFHNFIFVLLYFDFDTGLRNTFFF